MGFYEQIFPGSVLQVEETAPVDVESDGLDQLSEAERGRVIASRWTGEDVSDIISKEATPDDSIDDDEDDAGDDDEDSALLHEDDADDDYDTRRYLSPDSECSKLSFSSIEISLLDSSVGNIPNDRWTPLSTSAVAHGLLGN